MNPIKKALAWFTTEKYPLDPRIEKARRDALPVCPKCSGYGAFYSICDCGDGKDRSTSTPST